MKVIKNFKALEEYSTPVLELIDGSLEAALCAGSIDTNEPFEGNEDWGNISGWE